MTRVADVMNRELFHLAPGDRVATAARSLLALGITGCPVLDRDGAPLGVIALRDCMGEAADDDKVARRMSKPAITIRAEAEVADAARLLAHSQFHRLVVVDRDGHAIGMISAVDVIRALIGEPPRHPPAFPHHDDATGLTWTDDTPLVAENVEVAPAGPGVLLLVDGERGVGRVVWGEWTHELRTRLLDLVSLPQHEPALARLLERPHVWFRAAALPDGPGRARTVERVIAAHVGREPFVSH